VPGTGLGRSRLEAATSLRQLGPRGEQVIRSARLQPAGTWALSISLALGEAQRDEGADNEMRSCQASPEGGGDGCTRCLGASLSLGLKSRVSGAGSWQFGFTQLCSTRLSCRFSLKKQFIQPRRGDRGGISGDGDSGQPPGQGGRADGGGFFSLSSLPGPPASLRGHAALPVPAGRPGASVTVTPCLSVSR